MSKPVDLKLRKTETLSKIETGSATARIEAGTICRSEAENMDIQSITGAVSGASTVEPAAGVDIPARSLHYNMSETQLAVFRTTLCFNHQRNECVSSDRCPHSHCLTWQRRDPYLSHYIPKLCPEIEFLKRGNKMSLIRRCTRGRSCPFAHSKEEELYHPLMYKTKLCTSVPNCKRHFCPFGHSLEEIRNPMDISAVRCLWGNQAKEQEIESYSLSGTSSAFCFSDRLGKLGQSDILRTHSPSGCPPPPPAASSQSTVNIPPPPMSSPPRRRRSKLPPPPPTCEPASRVGTPVRGKDDHPACLHRTDALRPDRAQNLVRGTNTPSPPFGLSPLELPMGGTHVSAPNITRGFEQSGPAAALSYPTEIDRANANVTGNLEEEKLCVENADLINAIILLMDPDAIMPTKKLHDMRKALDDSQKCLRGGTQPIASNSDLVSATPLPLLHHAPVRSTEGLHVATGIRPEEPVYDSVWHYRRTGKPSPSIDTVGHNLTDSSKTVNKTTTGCSSSTSETCLAELNMGLAQSDRSWEAQAWDSDKLDEYAVEKSPRDIFEQFPSFTLSSKAAWLTVPADQCDSARNNSCWRTTSKCSLPLMDPALTGRSVIPDIFSTRLSSSNCINDGLTHVSTYNPHPYPSPRSTHPTACSSPTDMHLPSTAWQLGDTPCYPPAPAEKAESATDTSKWVSTEAPGSNELDGELDLHESIVQDVIGVLNKASQGRTNMNERDVSAILANALASAGARYNSHQRPTEIEAADPLYDALLSGGSPMQIKTGEMVDILNIEASVTSHGVHGGANSTSRRRSEESESVMFPVSACWNPSPRSPTSAPLAAISELNDLFPALSLCIEE